MKFSPEGLKTARTGEGLSQEQLARAAAVSVDAIRRAEQGRTTPSAETVARLAQALGVTMESLFVAEPAAA